MTGSGQWCGLIFQDPKTPKRVKNPLNRLDFGIISLSLKVDHPLEFLFIGPTFVSLFERGQ